MANNDEEIIEKRPSNPIATSCLLLAFAGMVGAIIFQVAEISSVRAGLNSKLRESPAPYEVVKKDLYKNLDDSIKAVIDANEHPEIKGTILPPQGVPGKGDEAAAPVAPAPAAEEKPAPAKDDAAAKDEKPADEAKADEAKADEAKADEAKTEEPKAEEKAEEPKADEAKADEPKAEEPAAEEPKAEEGEKTE